MCAVTQNPLTGARSARPQILVLHFSVSIHLADPSPRRMLPPASLWSPPNPPAVTLPRGIDKQSLFGRGGHLRLKTVLKQGFHGSEDAGIGMGSQIGSESTDYLRALTLLAQEFPHNCG